MVTRARSCRDSVSKRLNRPRSYREDRGVGRSGAGRFRHPPAEKWLRQCRNRCRLLLLNAERSLRRAVVDPLVHQDRLRGRTNPVVAVVGLAVVVVPLAAGAVAEDRASPYFTLQSVDATNVPHEIRSSPCAAPAPTAGISAIDRLSIGSASMRARRLTRAMSFAAS